MATDASFGDWLRRRRKALDLTQEALAEQVSCSVTTIRKIEADARRPSREMAELLANVLAIEAKARPTFLKLARHTLSADQDAAPSVDSSLAKPTQAAAPAAGRSQLPIPPTPLVGREAELTALSHLLAQPDCRLLTIVGPGGMGKTRLALEIATSTQMAFADGVYFASLAPLTSPEAVAPTLANLVGCVFAGSLDLKSQLFNHLSGKAALIILDNLEHLLAGVDLVSELIENTTRIKILVTSRERLNLQGEWVFDLYGLPVPPAIWRLEPTFEDGHYSSVALFVKSAQRVQARFGLTGQNAQDIARICRAVDGMPLGLELAAAWVHVLSCTEIADEIERNLDFLSSERRDLPARQRSVRAALDHSWRLLTAEERRLLCHLAVFRGGFRREAAQQISGANLQLLASLMDKSLLQRSASGRYDLHELVRQYARARLVDDATMLDTLGKLQRAHADYFLKLALAAEPYLGGPEQMTWLNRLEEEHNNLRAVLDWALDHGESDMGLQMAAALMWFWSARDHIGEGRQRLQAQLAQPAAQAKTVLRARALSRAGYLAYSESDYPAARRLLDEALALLQVGQADDVLTEALRFSAAAALLHADYALARSAMEQGLALAQANGQQLDVGSLLVGLGDVALHQNDAARAQTLYTQGIALIRQLQASNLLAYALRQRSIALLHLGDLTQADVCCRESLVLNQKTLSKQGVIACLAVLAALKAAHGQPVQAATLFGTVQAQLTLMGAALLPVDQREYAHNISVLRNRLEPTTFATAWAAGQALPLERAIAQATET